MSCLFLQIGAAASGVGECMHRPEGSSSLEAARENGGSLAPPVVVSIYTVHTLLISTAAVK